MRFCAVALNCIPVLLGPSLSCTKINKQLKTIHMYTTGVFNIELQLNLDIRALIIASRTNLELEARFAEVWSKCLIVCDLIFRATGHQERGQTRPKATSGRKGRNCHDLKHCSVSRSNARRYCLQIKFVLQIMSMFLSVKPSCRYTNKNLFKIFFYLFGGLFS